MLPLMFNYFQGVVEEQVLDVLDVAERWLMAPVLVALLLAREEEVEPACVNCKSGGREKKTSLIYF